MPNRRSERQRQTQLAFAPLPPSSPASANQPEAVRSRAAAVTIDMSPRKSRKKSTAHEFLPTPTRSSQNDETLPNLTLGSSPSTRSSRKSFMSSANLISASMSKRSRAEASFKVSDQSDSDGSDPTPVVSKKRLIHDDSESEDVVVSSSKRRRTNNAPLDADGGLLASTPTEAGHMLSLPDDSDSDAVVVPPMKTNRSLSVSQGSDNDVVVARFPRKVFTSTIPDVESDSDIAISRSIRRPQMPLESDSEIENTVSIAQSTRSAKAKLQTSENECSTSSYAQGHKESETEEEEDELPRKAARKSNGTNQVTPVRKKITRQDRNDLQEDLEFFKSTDTPPTRKRPSKHFAKQKALDALKKRRSKQKLKDVSTSNRHVIISSDEEEESDDHVVEEESDDAFIDELTTIAPENLDDDDDDFVIQDDNSILGAPIDLPVQFSRYQTMKPAALFKFAVEWMVQKKINPAFEMDDEMYRFSFERLDDFVKGLGGSKYQSSAWTSQFSKSLKSRPVLVDHRFINSGLLHDRCDACNRSGHPATWEVRFTGNCYDRNSLEEDSDEDSDEESPSAPSPSTTYYIGKFCMQNARTAHALAHWRFHLNEWVVDFLKDEGYCSAEKIIERDGWSIKHRRKYANKIVDKMQEAGEIKRLHRDFRNEINTAQYANESRWDNSSP